jgi:phosphoglucosamine mutase
MISALQVLTALRESGKTLSALLSELTMYPQVLINVRTQTKFDFASDASVAASVKDAETTLAGTGRVLLRASGTEPVIRVMVEGEDKALVTALAEKIAATVKVAAAR